MKVWRSCIWSTLLNVKDASTAIVCTSPQKHLFAVWICIWTSRFSSLFGVARDHRYTQNLWRLLMFCHQTPPSVQRRESTDYSQPKFCNLSGFHWFLALLCLLPFPMLDMYPEASNWWCRCHRHKRAFVSAIWILCN
jgi:hypothetical protein